MFARVLGHPEEGRYVQLRKEWKRHLALRFLFFFEFQALLDVVLSAPFLLACLNVDAPLGLLEKIGAGIWLVAMIGEAFADMSSKFFDLLRAGRNARSLIVPTGAAGLIRSNANAH